MGRQLMGALVSVIGRMSLLMHMASMSCCEHKALSMATA